METNCGLSDKKGKKPLVESDNVEAEVELRSDSALERLRATIRTNAAALEEKLRTPIALEQLEMLEAELRNQGILPSEQSTLAQHALHTASILRWRARRAGVVGDHIEFRVDVAKYVLSRSAEIEHQLRAPKEAPAGHTELLLHRSASWGKGVESPSRLLAELEYLEAFAAYLLGRFENNLNRYQRGLNLILRVLASRNRDEAAADSNVVLPMDMKGFLAAVRPMKEAAVTR